jgi:Acetyltransferase (GNAT) domain
MAQIRAFAAADIPQVAALHQNVFHTRPSDNGDRYRAYFQTVFLDNPSHQSDLPSLVYEESSRILGFLGVVPRRMSMHGQHLQAAISTQFVVEPGERSALVAVQLARTFFDGPQDLSISDEANNVARKLWERLGGTTAVLQSSHWLRPLRPAGLAVSFLRNRAGLRALALAADWPSRFVDVMATRLPRSRLFQSRPEVVTEDLRAETVLACLPELASGSLRVEYDARLFEWLLYRAARRRRDARLHKAVIRTRHTGVIGWYVYALDPHGIAQVLQIASRPGAVDLVLDALFYQAWRQGALAATGRLEPKFLEAFSDRYCLFYWRGPWLLVKSSRPEVVGAFQSGEASFSRFDGEWCLGF